MADKHSLHVAAAVIRNGDGEILIAKRPDHLHKGGLWEFPGGKVEASEDVRQALQRELQEELAIKVTTSRPMITVPYEYPEHHVLLEVYEVTEFSGEACGHEGQEVKWVAAEELDNYPFPEANLPIIRAAQLPTLYMISGGPAEHSKQFLGKLESALQRGIRLVQLRAKGLPEQTLIALAARSLVLCHRYGAKLLLNGTPEQLALLPGLDGVQLSSECGARYQQRPVGTGHLLGVSCHTPEQLRQAEKIGADFALLSPVQATATHPDDSPLGWECFAEWVAECTIPVYALGGMEASMLATAHQHGAQGVAAISALWEPQGD